MLKQRNVEADVLIDISELDTLDYVEENDETVRIGALTKHNTLLSSSIIASEFPAMEHMLDQLADEQIRNMGTIGGNIAQADQSADYPPLLAAMEAAFETRKLGGSRKIPASEFFISPNVTSMDDGELLSEIDIQKEKPSEAVAFENFSIRENDYAITNTCTKIGTTNGVCESARIYVGAVVPQPTPLKNAAEHLVGERLDSSVIKRAAEIASDEVEIGSEWALGSQDHREQLVYSLAKETIERATSRAEK
jgi:CO/xanthine dehydrogenase FAD-binding subunit